MVNENECFVSFNTRSMIHFDRSRFFDWKKDYKNREMLLFIQSRNLAVMFIDNKFTSLKGVFTFIKEEKNEPLENNDASQDMPENDLLIDENELDNQEDAVLEYPKKKRRRRRKSYNTDE